MRKVLVLGGYGLIGQACMRGLRAQGFAVSGLGRSRRAALAADPQAEWIIHDIPSLSAAEWRDLLDGVDCVVNAAGALQNGAQDDLRAIHVTAIERLVEAAGECGVRIVQISAAGAEPAASTAFLRTKAEGDALLAARHTDWVILRPALVLAPEAYGGSALLRGAASMPFVLPRLFPNTTVQTAFIDDLVAAVVASAQRQVPAGTIADLTDAGSHSFDDLMVSMRRWLGWPDPLWRPRVPGAVLWLLSQGADLLGHLGWRSAMRSTALAVLKDGVRGDPQAWAQAGGAACRPLDQTLNALPATRQERLFARTYFAGPLGIAVLSAFFVVSGVLALFTVPDAVGVLTVRGIDASLGTILVIGGALADLILGLGILWRRMTRHAALGMAGLSGGYLVASLVTAPDLWADPLGPMIKIFPALTLAILVWLMVEER